MIPMVPMKSAAEMPFSACTFSKTCSESSSAGTAGAAAAVWPAPNAGGW